MDRKTCIACHEMLDADQYYPRTNKCKVCTRVAVKANRAANIDYYRTYDRRRASDPKRVNQRIEHAKANPRPRPEPDAEKRAARVLLGNALRDGKVSRPGHCQMCAQFCTPHGHHDDYSKPLDVLWVCTSCHAAIHKYWRAKTRKAA